MILDSGAVDVESLGYNAKGSVFVLKKTVSVGMKSSNV
jgi:hypothetical protein